MLQFFKNSGRKKKDILRSSTSLSNYEVGNLFNKQDEVVEVEDISIDDAEKLCKENIESLENSKMTRSKLSKNLIDILLDKNCLSYFVQYLETKQALQLIKFWLDVESFRTASETTDSHFSHRSPSIKANKLEKISYNSKLELRPTVTSAHTNNKRIVNRSISSDGYDSLSYSSLDYDSLSLDYDNEEDEEDIGTSSSEYYGENIKINKLSLTDDEKSKIFDEKTTKFNSSITIDAIRIYRKYLISNSNYFIIEMPATILSNISLSLCSSHHQSINTTQTSSLLFDEAQKFVFNRLENEFLNGYLESVFYCKYTVDVLTSDNLTINDIIYNENVLFYFMEFLEKFNHRYYLDFLITAINFKKQIHDSALNYNHNQSQNDAMIIYDKYFSLQSTTTNLKMSKNVRFFIEENICKENDKKIDNCFDLPIQIIEYYLSKNFFNKFLKSTLFYKYLSELFNNIQECKTQVISQLNGKIKKKSQHRKTYSDCTNDNTRNLRNSFISTKNTLLAMESSNFNKKLNKLENTTSSDMHIDARHFNNPDLLWQRNSSCNSNNSLANSNLSFGRINSLGRYERDFDMDLFDDKWSGNKIKNAVKKFVKLPEDKVEEELAWQVAEMIVKDITNVTLNSSTT